MMDGRGSGLITMARRLALWLLGCFAGGLLAVSPNVTSEFVLFSH